MSPRLHAGVIRLSAFTLLASAFALGTNLAAQTPLDSKSSKSEDRGSAYYHYSLSKMYAEMAAANGRQDYATQAVEEYKLALGVDPESRMLQDGLPELYFTLGRIREAVSAAQEQVTKHPEDFRAHQLLGGAALPLVKRFVDASHDG